MVGEPTIDEWAETIAREEAACVRAEVRRALLEGRALVDALPAVRRRFNRLTVRQRETVVRTIAPSGEATWGR